MLQETGRLQEGELDPLSFTVESHASVQHRIGELYEIISGTPPADIVPPFDALASAFRDAVAAAPKAAIPASAAKDAGLEQLVRDHFSGAHVYGHHYRIKSVQLETSQWTIVRTGPLIQRRTRKGHTLVQVEGESFCRLYDATFWQEYDGVGYQHPGTVELDAFVHLASCR